MTELLIFGVYGQLGRAVQRIGGDRGVEVVGRGMDTVDITNPDAVEQCCEDLRPRTVVNCAAFTAVDRCEDEEELATKVNGAAVGHLAQACNRQRAKLVHISTDYVFPGAALPQAVRRPYREDDGVGLPSAYGRSKLLGEQLASTADNHLIVRTAWLFGHGGPNFVDAIRSQIEAGTDPLRVVSDQTGSPTFCDDLAGALLDLVAAGSNPQGVVHGVNQGSTTWYDFAVEIARLLAADVTIRPVTSAEFKVSARRPAYSVLDTSRLAAILGSPLPPWQDGLARYLGR